MLELIVSAVASEANGIKGIELAHPAGEPLPPFSAGAHLEVHLPGGLIRHYSLCGAPHDRTRYRLGVLAVQHSRGGSLAMHRLVVNDRLRVSLPRNHFELLNGTGRTVLLAGGIGITPLLSMAETLHKDGRLFELRYFARSREHAAFVRHLQAAAYADRVWVHFDQQGSPPQWPLLAGTYQPGDQLYTCGPAGFMAAVLSGARAHGWPQTALHQEHFGNAAGVGGVTSRPFVIELARSGALVSVAAGVTAAQALKEAGVNLAQACGQGVCGTCMTTVLAGTPDHRDLFMTAAEQARNDRFTPCCSRAHTERLVLDL